jgi:hypothetical protein
MESRWCNACGNAFQPRAQAPRQSYCTNPECQRERRRLWQQAKRRSDPDYLDNQLNAQRAWALRNPGYWRAWRARHPGYVEQNRQLQQARNRKGQSQSIANVDVSPLIAPRLPEGIYELRSLDPNVLAKMGVWTVQLAVIATRTQAHPG